MNTKISRGLWPVLLLAVACVGGAAEYDPLALPEGWEPRTLDLEFTDEPRQREIPLRVYLPKEGAAAPVVLFSHGLGGSRENSPYLGKHWSGRGYVVVFMQHAGSDSSVWRDKPLGERLGEMRDAASLKNFLLRVQDVPAVLDQLTRWNESAEHELRGRLDLEHVGMSGHSFGAVTTQAVSGQTFPLGGKSFTDPRIQAAVLFSPSGPRKGGDPKESFSSVKIPWLLMTGTNDAVPMLGVDVASRFQVYPALTPGHKYELTLDKAEHSAFGDRPLPGDKERRNPNHHRVILALSTAFWDAYLREDQAAQTWLDGPGPASMLEPEDRWQQK